MDPVLSGNGEVLDSRLRGNDRVEVPAERGARLPVLSGDVMVLDPTRTETTASSIQVDTDLNRPASE